MFKNLNWSVAVPRVLVGFLLFASGLAGLLHLTPTPAHPGLGDQYLGALSATYLMTLVKAVEVAVGLSLLTNRFVPLALVVLAPVSVNILGFHTLIDFGQLPVPVLLVVGHLWLAWSHRAAYAPLFRARTEVEAAPSTSLRPASA